ncbi:MAG TPA: hypothetical protein VH482_08010 [Thermomicrobiales bacterium]
MAVMLASVRRFDGFGQQPRFDGGRRLEGSDRTEPNIFVWRHGRDEVRLSPDGDGWSVSYLAVGKLLGPRQVLYEAKHKRAMHAAWDVMARVIRASRDEDEGIRVAQSAARWMRGFGIHDAED